MKEQRQNDVTEILVNSKITDRLVCEAFVASQRYRKTHDEPWKWPYDYLMEWTGLSIDECEMAMEDACENDLVECGVSLRTGWLTERGKGLIDGN